MSDPETPTTSHTQAVSSPPLAQVVQQLQLPNPNRTLVIEGPRAARSELVNAMATQLSSGVQRASPAEDHTAAAGDPNSILFFDEADSLFGKRSDVKDSHDRYANIEITNRVVIWGVENADNLPPEILKRSQKISVTGH